MSIVPILFTVLPIAIVSSYWVTARNGDNNKKDASSRKLQHNYFQGVNYLINNEPDRAVDVFVKMLEVDSDTVETHLALGALFRRKGEVNRALRIHQNLIARPQLSIEYKNQALAALGEDYLRAGVFDRAESIFLELVDSSVIQARELKFLLHIYQQEKDWNKAIKIAQKLALVEKKSQHLLVAHYYCELHEACSNTSGQKKENYLKKALSIDTNSIRALLLHSDLLMRQEDYQAGLEALNSVIFKKPGFVSEVIHPMKLCYEKMNQQEAYHSFLEDSLMKSPSICVARELADIILNKEGVEAAISFFQGYLSNAPSLQGIYYLSTLYEQSSNDNMAVLSKLGEACHDLIESEGIYLCSQCGLTGKILHWLCPGCHRWSTTLPVIN